MSETGAHLTDTELQSRSKQTTNQTVAVNDASNLRKEFILLRHGVEKLLKALEKISRILKSRNVFKEVKANALVLIYGCAKCDLEQKPIE